MGCGSEQAQAPAPGVACYDADFYDDAFIDNQQAHFRAMRDLGPVIWLPRHGNYAITRHAELSSALRNWQVFSSAHGVAGDAFGCQFSRGGTLTSDPPLHDSIRKVSVAPLRPSALAGDRSAIQREAEDLVDRLVARGHFDGIVDFARHLPLTMVTEFVGLPEEGRANMLTWAAAGFNILGCQNARGQAGVATATEMREWVVKHVRPDTMKPGSWSARLSALAASGQIPEEYVPLVMRDYLGPSLDTTISATGQLIYQLGRHPDQWELLRQDPSLIPAAVHEAIRLASPVRSFTRTLTQDHALGGVQMPKGARVMMLYACANRDERQFAHPDRFDVMRGNSGHLGFGMGIHICEGQHLAQMEMQSLLQAMITRVGTIEVGEPTLAYNNTIFGFASLPVRWTPVSKARPASRTAAVRDGWVEVRVAQREMVAKDIVSLVLESVDGGPLPACEAGAHVDVKLPGGLIRQYSLCASPAHQGRYRLGILREPHSRGGSESIHRDLRQGARLQVSSPRNLFPLAADAPGSILLAGGIGITPILAMAYALQARGRAFHLHYANRELSRAAFADEMRAAFGDRLSLYADDAQGAPRLDLERILAESDPARHIYCCGPGGFIDHVLSKASAAGWSDTQLHVERFSAQEVPTAGSFTVVARRSGIELKVQEGTTILQAMLDAGIDVPFACESGICGTCLCKVLEGTPRHQDHCQTDVEKALNDRIAVCCSRALSERLVLDI